MEQVHLCGWYHPGLGIAVEDRRHVFLLAGTEPVPLHPEVYKGNLVFRARGAARRYSAAQLRKGLVRKATLVRLTVPNWL